MNRRLSWLLLALFSVPALADFKGSVTFATDYVYRGYTKSRNNPVGLGNLEYEHEIGLYAGLWVAPVSFDDEYYDDRARVEINPYLGWATKFAKNWKLDLAASRYLYDGKVFGQDSDYNELYGSLHYRDFLSARVAFAYDTYNRGAKTLAYELVGRYSPVDRLQLSAGVGFHQAGELAHYDYFFWNAGVTWYVNRYISVDLRYVDTKLPYYEHHEDEPENGSIYLQPLDDRFLFSLSVGF